MAVHCRFLQEAILEGLHKTHRLAYEAVYSSCKVYLVYVEPNRLLI